MKINKKGDYQLKLLFINRHMIIPLSNLHFFINTDPA